MAAGPAGPQLPPVTVHDVAASSDRLVASLDALDEGGWSRPSALPGWTVSHVVAHVALNAEALTRVAADCRDGRLGVMYPGGPDARAADISVLAGSSARALIARLTSAIGGFEAAYPPLPAGEFAGAPGAPRADVSEVPFRRLREVEVHGTATGIGDLGPRSWSDAYVDADLPVQWETVARRTREPGSVADENGGRWVTGGPAPEVRLERRTLLAWLLDRSVVPALPGLSPWGDQSRWLPAPD